MDQLMARQNLTVTVPDAGTWVLKRPTLGVQLQIEGRVAARLNGPVAFADPDMVSIARALAMIELCTVEAPKGWDWDSQPDSTVLLAVWQKWQDAQAAFKSDVDGGEKPVGDAG